MGAKTANRRRKNAGRIDLWIMIGVTLLLLGSVVIVTLRLLDQSEKHVRTIKETKVAYDDKHQWNPESAACDEQIANDLRNNPDIKSARYEELELTKKSMQTIGRLRKLEELLLIGSTVKDEYLVYLTKLRRLTKLDLSATEITDAGLPTLGQMTGLHVLSLEDTGVTDEGVKQLKSLVNLEDISFRETKVTADGIKELVSLPNLRYMYLTGPKQMTLEAMDALVEMPALYSLRLEQGNLTVEMIEKLQKAKNLRKLMVQSCELNDEKLAAIAKIPGLMTLGISQNPGITDKGLSQLSNCKTLTHVWANACPAITEKGTAQFRKKLPSCFLEHKVAQATVIHNLMSTDLE